MPFVMLARYRDILRAGAFMAGCLLLATMLIRFGPARILSLLTSLGWKFAVTVCIFTAHELIRSLAIRRWLPAAHRPPATELLRIRLLGEAAGALTRTGSFAAEPARAWLLARRAGQAVPGYTAAAGELTVNSAVSAAVNVVVTGSVLLGGSLKGPVIVLAHVLLWASLAYVSMVVGIVASRVRLLDAYARVAARLPLIGYRLRIDDERLRAIREAIGSVPTQHPTTLARILLLESAAQVLLVCEIYWTIRSLGVPVSGLSALFIEVMTRGLTTIEFVGATEMGFALVFTWLGMPAAIGFTLSLVKTLRSVTAAGIGISVLACGERLRAVLLSAQRPRNAVLYPEG
jgi:hypothetical protein